MPSEGLTMLSVGHVIAGIERHLRLNEEQLDHLVGQFHEWRRQQNGENGQPKMATSPKRVRNNAVHLL